MDQANRPAPWPVSTWPHGTSAFVTKQLHALNEAAFQRRLQGIWPIKWRLKACSSERRLWVRGWQGLSLDR